MMEGGTHPSEEGNRKEMKQRKKKNDGGGGNHGQTKEGEEETWGCEIKYVGRGVKAQG